MSIEPVDSWFQVQHSPFQTNLVFSCKTETLGSLYSHVVLILPKSSKSKNQVGHDQISFLSSTCQISSERWVLDLYQRSRGSKLTGGNILLLEFFCFQVVNPLIPILTLFPIWSSLWKLYILTNCYKFQRLKGIVIISADYLT